MKFKLSPQETKELTYMAFISMLVDYDDLARNKKLYKKHLIPELVYVLDVDSIVRLIKHFPKQLIRIPSEDELREAVKEIMYYYYREVRGFTKERIINELDLEAKELPKMQDKVSKLKEFFNSEDFKIPDALCKSRFMIQVQKALKNDG